MSWNTSRILNDLEYEINQNKQDISMLEQKTLYISDQLSLDGTVFVNNVYSEAFVKNGGTSTQYLMADGSTTTSSQQGQPNIYLYNNNNSGTPEPASGQIRANDPNNQNVTELYISVITSDGIDIDVFLQQISTISVIYLQDRNNSNNNVRFNVTGALINNPNLYVTVPVIFDIAQGTGSIDFGDGHPLFMSIFDNSVLIDSRISAVETKTQHQSATSLETRFNSPVNMFDHKIYNVADPVDLSDVSTKNYVDTSISALDLASYTPLSEFNDLVSTVTTQGQYINELEVVTQNQSATASLTTFVDSTQLLLDTNQFFGIKSPDLLSNYLIVTPISINTYLPINMDAKALLNVSGVKISGADTSNYFIKSNGTVDTNTYLQSADLSALETKTQNITATSTITTIEKSSQFRLSNSNTFSITDDSGPFISVTKLLVTNSQINAQIPMSMNTYKLNGIPTPTNNDDAVNKLFVDTNVALKLNLTGGNLSGALNMGNNKITLIGEPTLSTDASSKNYVDTQDALKLSLSGGTMTGSIIMNTKNITGAGFISSTTYYITSGVPNSVVFSDNGASINTNGTNLYCQSGGTATLQNVIDQIQTGIGNSIQLSSGTFSGDITFTKQNVIICGASCPLFAPTSVISLSLTIGSTSTLVTRLKVKDVVVSGALTFVSSATFQQCRYYFSNCEFSSDVVFPTAVNGSPWIYFFDCSFSGASAITLPNTTCSIVFTRCNFNNQTITNSASFGYLTFRECTGLNSLSVTNAIYYGMNALSTGVSRLNAVSVTLGGTATSLLLGNGTALSGTVNQFVKGNGTLTVSNANSIMKGDATTLAGTASQYVMGDGTLLTATYPTITTGSFNVTFSGSAGGSTTSTTISMSYRLVADGTSKIVFLRFPAFSVTQGTTVQNFIEAPTGSIPTALIPTLGLSNMVFISNSGITLIGVFTIFTTTGAIRIIRSDSANIVAGSSFATGANSCIQYFV